MSTLNQWAVAILCATGFVSLVIFYLSAGMNGMRYTRPAPLYVAIGCFVAIYLLYGNSVIGH